MIINSIHKVLTLSVIILSFMACEGSKSANNKTVKEVITKVSMEKTTLGNSSLLAVDKNEVSNSSKMRGGEEKVTTSDTKQESWKEINHLVSELDLNEMANWEAPTQARFYDGARATTIIIESSEGIFNSQSFDEGEPPVQLQELYNYLESLVNQ